MPLQPVCEQEQEDARAEGERGGERAERAGEHFGDGVHTAVPEAGKTPAATSISPTTVQAVPTIAGTDSGRGPWSDRRKRRGTDIDLSPSSVTDIASRGFA